MFNYTCLNPIAGVGLDLFSDDYKKVDDIKDADAALVRSAAMHDMELGDKVLAVARAGAGVNNIPLDKCAEHVNRHIAQIPQFFLAIVPKRKKAPEGGLAATLRGKR